MREKVLVTGGCRSGKTARALWLAESCGAQRKIYIATCVPRDPEMEERVSKHKAERGSGWVTLEEPLLLAEAVARESREGTVLLVDCLTLWLSNLLVEGREEDALPGLFSGLAHALGRAAGPVICVSNEVGAGIVPENALARRFRDLSGLLNQRVACAADRVLWMVAGIPVQVKGGGRP
ncbi:MAG: bifunctional adenosylcobinamide kinase/adenosylcobinamide-phosphate guanylyltransferase [Thermodesulfobacteriota bacterium]